MHIVRFNILAELKKFKDGRKTKVDTVTLLHCIADEYIARHATPRKK